jgi:hypothetical protein
MRGSVLLVLKMVEELVKFTIQSGHLPTFAIHLNFFYFFVGTLFIAAIESGFLLHGVFSQHEIASALRTGFRHRFIPSGELAFGEIAAPMEKFSPLGLFLQKSAPTTGRTDYSCILSFLLNVLAARVIRTGCK